MALNRSPSFIQCFALLFTIIVLTEWNLNKNTTNFILFVCEMNREWNILIIRCSVLSVHRSLLTGFLDSYLFDLRMCLCVSLDYYFQFHYANVWAVVFQLFFFSFFVFLRSFVLKFTYDRIITHSKNTEWKRKSHFDGLSIYGKFVFGIGHQSNNRLAMSSVILCEFVMLFSSWAVLLLQIIYTRTHQKHLK